ncbi:Sec-independent protein translocase subunit TatA/TatB [Salinimicrobium sp. GXAS 041]|uniref:Sec-independent protein translocase subunit TatA/TatB n=1 Tax=Salinimicrobium sp. GXAS 041 TaxID=3400806 RepID=UPI003C75B70F
MTTLPLFLSGPEIAFIFFILIMVFGADKIPDLAKGLGKGLRGIKNATNDIKSEVMSNVNEQMKETGGVKENIQKQVDETKEEIKGITNSINSK